MKINKILNLIVFVLLFFIHLQIYSQTRHKTEANADIVEYTTQDGLPTTNISNIVQTKDGYIWITGIEGTYRFDGYLFDDVGEKYGVPDMQNMYYDSTKNMLYFASPEKFVTFDGTDFKVFGEKEGYKLNGSEGQLISFITKDSRDRIWIGSSMPFVDKEFNGGLTKFEDGKFTVFDSTTFPLHNATNLIETPYGDILFSSSGRNTQTGEESYIALYKNGVFKKIGPEEGVYLQNAIMFPLTFSNSIDKEGNTWLAFRGVNTFLSSNSKDQNNTSGFMMYDGNKFHQFPELHNMIPADQIPIMTYYSKDQDKVFATTFSIKAKQFKSDNKTIYEYKNGRWNYSKVFKEIGYIKNLKTNKRLNDFSYSSTFLTKKNKYFPELLVFNSIATNQSQSSKYPSQFFTHSSGKWEKFDAFKGFPISGVKDGYMVNTNDGFGIYYPNKSKMLTEEDGLLKSQGGIPFLYSDRNGIVWISYSYSDIPAYVNISNTGINFWDGKSLRKYSKEDGLKSNITFNIYQDTKERVWIATDKGIVNAREIKNGNGDWIFKFNNIPSDGKKDYNVSSIYETSNGEIYTWQNYIRPKYGEITKANFYLGKFDGNKFVEIESPFSDVENSRKYQLISLKESYNNTLWLEGLFADNLNELTSVPTSVLIYDGKKWRKPDERWNIPNEQLHYVGTLDNGMYFLTAGGFYNFNGDKFINLIDSVDVNTDFRILKGASVAGTQTEIQAGNRLYIRLRNRGLVIFDGTNLKFYTKKNGLPSASISNPNTDSKGNLTFGFPSGALVVNGENFQAYYDEPNVATGGVYGSAIDINDNLLMFYSNVGLYIRKIEDKSYPLKISSVAIDTSLFYYTFPTDLSYNQNYISFEFAALNFKDPTQTNYEYILEGYDKSWSRPSEIAYADYQNIPPGAYTFKVKGITSNGVKTNETSYSFVISPPFWMTWWAYSLYVIILGVALINIRKYEKRRMKLREAIRVKEERATARLREAELRAQMSEAENERKSKELEEARQLQLSMLPKELPELPHLDIAVYMKTATEVGGDYYDFHIGMDGTLTAVLGDATGHGIKAGTMVTAAKSLFNSYASNKDILFTFQEMGRCIKQMHFQNLSMCMTMLKIQNDKISMSSAGMPPVYIYRKDSDNVQEYQFEGMPLGTMTSFPYKIKECKLNSGDVILLLTDGLPELKNNIDEQFGYRKVRNAFLEMSDSEPEDIITNLKEAGSEWVSDKDPDDDVTFVVIKVK